MNLMHLRYFCKLAEIENYTIAASELYISQPGLSGAIVSIEKELGVKLFEKNGRNIKLTKCGKEFYEYCNESFRILDKGIAVMHEYAGRLSGKIEIGAIPTIQTTFLPEVISRFREKNELVDIVVFEGQTKQILDYLQDSVCDVGFCTHDVTNSSDVMEAIPVLKQKVVAIMDKNHPLADKEIVSFEDIFNYRIYTYSPSYMIGKKFKELICNKTDDPDKLKISDDFPNELLIAGILARDNSKNNNMAQDGIGLIANVPYLEHFGNLKVIPVADVPDDFRKVYMIYNKKKSRTHAVDLFINFVRDNFSLDNDN